MVRLITKLEGFLGVAQLLTQYGGRNKSAAAQILLSSLMQDIEILRSCIQVAEAKGHLSPGGTWAPLLSAAYRVHSIEASDRAERTMEGLLTSTLMLSGGASDLSAADIGPLIERYFRKHNIFYLLVIFVGVKAALIFQIEDIVGTFTNCIE